MVGGETSRLHAVFAAATADIFGGDAGGTVCGAEEIDVVFEESYDGRGFEEEGDIFVAAGAVAGFVGDVAFFEVGGSGFGVGAVGEDGEEVGPGQEGGVRGGIGCCRLGF